MNVQELNPKCIRFQWCNKTWYNKNTLVILFFFLLLFHLKWDGWCEYIQYGKYCKCYLLGKSWCVALTSELFSFLVFHNRMNTVRWFNKTVSSYYTKTFSVWKWLYIALLACIICAEGYMVGLGVFTVSVSQIPSHSAPIIRLSLYITRLLCHFVNTISIVCKVYIMLSQLSAHSIVYADANAE